MRKVSLVGKRFGLLKVEKELDSGQYACVCDCGGKSNPHKHNLRNGNTRSCGCLRLAISRRPMVNPGKARVRDPNKIRLYQERYNKRYPGRRREIVARYRRRNPLKHRQQHFKRRYGITPEDYTRMWKEQGGLCAICRGPESITTKKTGELQALSVDHCHKTKRVRKLLCKRCNTLLGLAKDDPTVLKACEEYLGRYLVNQ